MRIGLIGDNSVEFVNKLLHIWRKGNCAVVIDWRIPFKIAEKLLSDAGVSFCYIDSGIINFQQENALLAGINYIPYSSEKGTTLLPKEIVHKYQPNYTKDEALILFSSGTTGANKGIILSFSAINNNADSVKKYMQLQRDDAIYIVKSLAHSSTIVGELLVGLKTHCNIYISSTIVPPQYTLNNIERLKITTIALNPSMISLYCKAEAVKAHDYSKLKAVYTSGSKLDSCLIKEFRRTFNSVPLLNVYGLTEAGPRVTAQTLANQCTDYSVGKAIDGVSIRIDSTAYNCKEYGEICVKTKALCSGYISGSPLRISDDGWLHTGDLGYIDKNENLYVVGRVDNMVIVGSHNVFPEDVEKTILSSGLVFECIVYSKKDLINGMVLMCDYIAETDLHTELKTYCDIYLAPYEIPRNFNKVAQIPKTYNGKKRRNHCG